MQAELAALAHDLVTSMEPGFESITLRASCSGGGSSHRTTVEPSGYDGKHLHDLATLGAVGLKRPVVFEMHVAADGTFEAVVTEQIIQATGHLPPTYTVVRKPRPRVATPVVTSLADVEAVIGASLPAEVHELFSSGIAEDFDDATLLAIEEILDYREMLADIADRDPQEWHHPVLYVGPPGRCGWSSSTRCGCRSRPTPGASTCASTSRPVRTGGSAS